MKIFSLLLIAIFSLSLFSKNAEAKVLPQAAKGGSKVVPIKSSGGGGIGVSPKLRGDRRALIVYFSNLQNAKTVSYTLTYSTNTQQEGAIGSLNLGSSTATQELLFGTCSRNVCRYHSGVNNARLEVSYTSQVGKKYLKKYKIKI